MALLFISSSLISQRNYLHISHLDYYKTFHSGFEKRNLISFCRIVSLMIGGAIDLHVLLIILPMVPSFLKICPCVAMLEWNEFVRRYSNVIINLSIVETALTVVFDLGVTKSS